MFYHRIDHQPPRSVILHWFLLSFLAGSINAGGLLSCGRFVSHMTGFYTLFGKSAASLRWDEMLGLFTIPIYFLVGSMISAVLVEHPIHRGQKPHYSLVMFMECVCLFLAAGLGYFGGFGDFGDSVHLKADYVLLALLCMASGLQNSAVSCASEGTVRTTHMTGNTTDLGIEIVRIWSLRKKTFEKKRESRTAWTRAGIMFSFAIGSAVGAALFIRFHYLGFIFTGAIALYIAIRELWGKGKNLSPAKA
jgi:uncharacterized membrane protein YoaK (UPF0700 family)